MAKKQSCKITLVPAWSGLLQNTLSRIAVQIAECSNLLKLIPLINALIKTIPIQTPESFAALQQCRERLPAFIQDTQHIDILIKTTYTIARVAKNFDPAWMSLLDICCDRLNALVPAVQSLDLLVKTLNCIAKIAPLIADDTESPVQQDSVDSFVCPVDTLSASAASPLRNAAAFATDGTAERILDTLSPHDPVSAREAAETICCLQTDIRQN